MKSDLLAETIVPIFNKFSRTKVQDLKLAQAADISLLGPEGYLESIQLVTFLIELEEIIKDQRGHEIRIISDRAMSQQKSPFRNLDTLADFIIELIQESKVNK